MTSLPRTERHGGLEMRRRIPFSVYPVNSTASLHTSINTICEVQTRVDTFYCVSSYKDTESSSYASDNFCTPYNIRSDFWYNNKDFFEFDQGEYAAAQEVWNKLGIARLIG